MKLEELNKSFADWYQKHQAEMQPAAWADGWATTDTWTTESNWDQPEEVIDAD